MDQPSKPLKTLRVLIIGLIAVVASLGGGTYYHSDQ